MSEPTPLAAAAAGACPRCGKRTIFAGWVQFEQRCRQCALDLDSFNVGDGPAAFLILIIGALLTIASTMLELAVSPPAFVHAIWLPLGIALTLFGLRFGKTFLLAQEYRHRAREGRLQP